MGADLSIGAAMDYRSTTTLTTLSLSVPDRAHPTGPRVPR